MKQKNKYKIIGKCQNLYMLTSEQEATLHSIIKKAFIINDSGQILTEELPINYLLRLEEMEWEEVNEPYEPRTHNKSNVVKDALLGFAVGDALGVPYEFLQKKEIEKLEVEEMLGMDIPHSFESRWGNLVPAGAWSDDTSMTIATMDSMIADKGELNYSHWMQHYLDWLTKGKYSSIEKAFGLGNTIYNAIKRYCDGVEALSCGGDKIKDNGNGSLMRMLPVSLYAIMNNKSRKETATIISNASSITHRHDISKMSCFIYTEFMKNLILKRDPDLALDAVKEINYQEFFSEEAIQAHSVILKDNLKEKDWKEINGSGYVVDTLECALYSILNSNNYEDAVKLAIKTGYDTDTIAGVTGSLAGILYGSYDIPEKWVKKLRKREYLENLANQFYDMLQRKEQEEKTSKK